MKPSGDALARFSQDRRDAWVASVAQRLPPGTKLLDVGAGACRYRPLFAHCDYKAQDFCGYEGTSEGMFKDDWAYGKIDYVCDVTAIPVPDGTFDAVLCTEVLEHVPRPDWALRELARILKPAGRLFLSAPLGAGLHQEPHDYYGGFTPHFYRRFLGEAGFDIVSIEPNGRFFKSLLQEVHRAGQIIQARRPYRFWHPLYWLIRAARSGIAARWLTRLDEEVPVAEFTVGYHVEAVRKADGLSRADGRE